MTAVLAGAAYLAYLVFWLRGLWHGLLWLRSNRLVEPAAPRPNAAAIASGVLDIVFFRRLFSVNKLAWLGSWTFHASFLLVLACHLRYFMKPVPDLVGFLQPAGVVAGFVMPCAACLLLVVRVFRGKDAYTSRSNYALLVLAALIGATGALMRLTGSADVIAAKGFAHGLLSFRPGPAPSSWLFIVHFLGALVIVPMLPTHIVAAPLVIVEAKRREYELPLLLHGK